VGRSHAKVFWIISWTLLILDYQLGPSFFSENTAHGNPKTKLKLQATAIKQMSPYRVVYATSFWSERFRPIINIYTAKHPDEESKMHRSKKTGRNGARLLGAEPLNGLTPTE